MLCIKSTIYLTGQANNNDRNSKPPHAAQAPALRVEPVWNLMLEICDLIDFWCWNVMILNNM